jgi:hypothetical protein
MLVGDAHGARREFRRIPDAVYLNRAGLAIEALSRGDRDGAAPHLAVLRDPGRPRLYAQALAAIVGADLDGGFRLLEEAAIAHEDWIAAIQGEPLLRHVRDDPRLRAIVERMGFPHGAPKPVSLMSAASDGASSD